MRDADAERKTDLEESLSKTIAKITAQIGEIEAKLADNDKLCAELLPTLNKSITAVVLQLKGERKLVWRVTAHYDSKFANQQDREVAHLSYFNILKEIRDTDKGIEFCFVFSLTGPTNTVSKEPLTAHPINPDIQTIRMWYCIWNA